MSEQLVVNVASFETRIALLEGGVVTELMIERNTDRGLVGTVFLGKVQRVLPGMHAAFVELGIGKAAFLYVGDVVRAQPTLDLQDSLDEAESEESQDSDEDSEIIVAKKRKNKEKLKIEELLKP